MIKKLKKYVDDPNYTPESVAKQSRAAMSLCMWTRAMDVYNRVSKVGPVWMYCSPGLPKCTASHHP